MVQEKTDHHLLTAAGILPFKKGPIRFAVGPPAGLTSNAWKVWTSNSGDVYIACRDNFKEAKVSLHISGRWRMGFTTEAIKKNPKLLSCDQNRAWDVWDRPVETIPNTVIAFRLLFPTSELGVSPQQRDPAKWRKVHFIEASPPGKMTVVTLFITNPSVILRHESEPSFCLASLAISNDQCAQLLAHFEPEGDLPTQIETHTAAVRQSAEAAGVIITTSSFGYFLGRQPDGSRFLFGANIIRRHHPDA